MTSQVIMPWCLDTTTVNSHSIMTSHISYRPLILASAIREIWLMPTKITNRSVVAYKPARQTAKFWNINVTITRPLLLVICHLLVRIGIAYLCTKFDDFKFSLSSDMIGTQKCLTGHMTWPCPCQGPFVVSRLWLAHLTSTSNLESLQSPITKMHKAMQNLKIEVV